MDDDLLNAVHFPNRKAGIVTEEAKGPFATIGVPYDQFKAAVTALVELRDDAQVLIFLAAGLTLRIIGDKAVIRTAFARHASKPDVEEAEATSALEEVRQLLYAQVVFGESAPDFLENTLYGDTVRRAKGAEKDRLTQSVKDKLGLVKERLVTGVLQERHKRLTTSRTDCLDDVDVEVVRDRYVKPTDLRVSGPYLKLHIRVSRGPSLRFPFAFFRDPAHDAEGIVKTFELECDETDLALLEDRIKAFRALLLKATEETSRDGGGQ